MCGYHNRIRWESLSPPSRLIVELFASRFIVELFFIPPPSKPPNKRGIAISETTMASEGAGWELERDIAILASEGESKPCAILVREGDETPTFKSHAISVCEGEKTKQIQTSSYFSWQGKRDERRDAAQAAQKSWRSLWHHAQSWEH